MNPSHYYRSIPLRTTGGCPLSNLPQPQILGGWPLPPALPQSQFPRTPRVPGDHLWPVPSNLYPRRCTPGPNGYLNSPRPTPVQEPSLPTLRPEPVTECISGLKYETELEPEDILRTGMTPTPRPYDPLPVTGIYHSAERDEDPTDSGVDAGYGNGGTYGSGLWPGPETDVSHETTSPSCGTLETAYEEYHHHHHYHYHHSDEDPDATPAAPWHPDQSRDRDHNADDRNPGGTAQTRAEELGSPPMHEEGDGDGDYIGGDETSTSHPLSTTPTWSPSFSSTPNSDSLSSGSGPGSDSSLEEEETAGSTREHQHRAARLRDLTAFARSAAAAADIPGRPIIVVAGDCYYNRLAAAPTSGVAPILLMAGDLHGYPGATPASRQKRRRRRNDGGDDVREGGGEGNLTGTDARLLKRLRPSRRS